MVEVKNNLKTVNSATQFHKHAVDHRPTRLLVSGYETDEQEAVLSHFQVIKLIYFPLVCVYSSVYCAAIWGNCRLYDRCNITKYIVEL